MKIFVDLKCKTSKIWIGTKYEIKLNSLLIVWEFGSLWSLNSFEIVTLFQKDDLKDWRRGGVLECMKNDQIKAIVEEAEYQEAVKQGYYDEDGNYIYYTEAELAAQPAVQPAAIPKTTQPQKPIQNQKVVRIYEIFFCNPVSNQGVH